MGKTGLSTLFLYFFTLFSKKIQKKFAGFKKMPTFASAFEKNA